MDFVVTILPVLVALLTVVGGMVAYTLQKRQDRKLERAREKRQVYRDYLASMQVYKLRTIRTDHKGRRKAVEDFLAAEAMVLVFAPGNIAEKTKAVSRKFKDYIDAIRGVYETNRPQATKQDMADREARYLKEFDELVELMRDDVS